MTTHMTPFPAVHSVLCTQALAGLVAAEYAPTSPVACQLLKRNISDTYLVTGLPEHRRAALRVYRSGWRSSAEVGWELDFIGRVAGQSVGGQRVAVSRPLPRRNGELMGLLSAAEGPRLYVLFEWVEGRTPSADAADAAAYGSAAAALHSASDGVAPGGRFHLNLDHLITEPLALVRPLLAETPALWQELEDIAARVHGRLSPLLPELEWGACHGDLHRSNARIGPSGQVRLFDFDCGGPGWRAYDLAVYWWSQASGGSSSLEAAEEAWRAFVTAYQGRRVLGVADLEAAPHFVMARSIWFVGLMAGLVQEFGTEMLGTPVFEYDFNFMRTWEARQGAQRADDRG